MITCKRMRELQEAKRQLKKVHTLLEEDLHNISLQEDVARLKTVVRKEEEDISKREQVHA
jgi:hypothetical protein